MGPQSGQSPPPWKDAAIRLFHAARAKSVLVVGPAGADWFEPHLRECAECTLDSVAPAQVAEALGALGRYDFALVSGTLESLPHPVATTVLARLRDVHARRLLVAVCIGADRPDQASHWSHGELLGYGFRLVGQYREERGPVHLYRFDLYDYKTTPDWLNSKHWAHPELWDKYRW